jgi:hypothetical protein
VRHQQGSEAYQQGLADWNEFFNHWHSIMKSPDEKEFDQRVQELERRYLPQYTEEVGYIKANWLDPYKERLVRAVIGMVWYGLVWGVKPNHTGSHTRTSGCAFNIT